MKKITQHEEFQLKSDLSENILSLSRSFINLLDNQTLGCTIKFNTGYALIWDDNTFPSEIHLSINETQQMISFLSSLYPDSNFAKKFMNF